MSIKNYKEDNNPKMYYQHCSAAVQKLVVQGGMWVVPHRSGGGGMVYEALASYIATNT
jgi:hypothetical protein